jgi:hypothetical protein
MTSLQRSHGTRVRARHHASKMNKTCTTRLVQRKVYSPDELAVSNKAQTIVKHIAEQGDVFLRQTSQALGKEVHSLLELIFRHTPHPLAEPPRHFEVFEGVCHLERQRTARVRKKNSG